MDELRRLDASHDSMDEPLGTLSALSPHKNSTPQRGIRSNYVKSFDLFAASLLTFAQLVFSGAMVFGALLTQFAFDACGSPNPECNYLLGQFALFMVPIACVLIFALTVAMIVARYRLARPAWWVPVAGAGASLIALAVSALLTIMATSRPPW